jgi:hypothetical protein
LARRDRGLIAGTVALSDRWYTYAQYRWLHREGIRLYQGYLFCRPAFEELRIETEIPR